MMMPANYSVIAENEMTYVNGGASFIDAIGAVTAPIWTLDNVKTFNTNIVTLVGNTFLSKVVNQTIGVLFSGNTTWKAVGAIPRPCSPPMLLMAPLRRTTSVTMS